MYAAMLNKKLVLAIDEADLIFKKVKSLNQDHYYCPHCQKRVILIVSEQKTAFFKHWVNHENAMGEKEEHHTSKMLLKSAFTAAGFDAQTEISLAAGQIRADVLVSNKLALEVQCAPLSEEEFNHRHNLYKQAHILDLWIVGKRHYLRKNLKKTQLIFFRENQLWGKYYFEIDPKQAILRLKYNIRQEPITRRLCYQQASFNLDEIDLVKLWHFQPFLRKYPLNPDFQKNYLIKQIRQKSRLGLQIGSLLYQQQLTVADLPESLFSKWRKPGEIDPITKYLNKKADQR